MSLSVGIVGLPNVGKSTLFNALLKKQVADVANYPFCTIEPNIGVVEVPDERLKILSQTTKIEKIIPAVVQFFDIAGLVKGASCGEGLGNKFLSHIRDVAAIIHVVRLFEESSIVHVGEEPIDDIKTVETELMLSDLYTLQKQESPKANASKEELFFYEISQKAKRYLDRDIPIRRQNLSDEELKMLGKLNLLTAKPELFLFNLSEKHLENLPDLPKIIDEIAKSFNENILYIHLCAKLENEILTLSQNEQKEYLETYHLKELGLNRLIKKTYEMLGLISFFTTTGGKEIRAWTIKNGTKAKKAAGVIHTDFENNFIKADVIPFEKFISLEGWAKAREQGSVQSAGKDYEIKDGEVVEFKTNA